MTKPTQITSPDNPRVKAVLRLRKQRERRRAGRFIAEGVREVARAAEAGLGIREVFICEALLGDASAIAPKAVERFDVSEQVMRKLAYRENPEGVVAVVATPDRQLDQIPLDAASEPPLILVTVGASKPGNLGAMARSAEAAGCAALVVVEGVVDAFNPNAIRASTGAVFTLPIVAASTEKTLAWLGANRVRIIAADAVTDQSQAHWVVKLTGPVAIVIGTEDVGLPEQWIEAADARARIEMRGRAVDSLNASVAAAVMLFEAARQRASHFGS